MLSFTDPRWRSYKGGYRTLYDVSIPLRHLINDEPPQAIWDELWQELHHQGDVDTASYAAVPYLVMYAQQSLTLDWNVFGLVSTIELARPHNPPPPPEIADAYFQAISTVPAVVGQHPQEVWDDVLTQCIVACVALARGQRVLARAYSELHLEAAQHWLQHEYNEERANE